MGVCGSKALPQPQADPEPPVDKSKEPPVDLEPPVDKGKELPVDESKASLVNKNPTMTLTQWFLFVEGAVNYIENPANGPNRRVEGLVWLNTMMEKYDPRNKRVAVELLEQRV
jgi:hypothetical protein